MAVERNDWQGNSSYSCYMRWDFIVKLILFFLALGSTSSWHSICLPVGFSKQGFLWKWLNYTGLGDGAYVIDYNGKWQLPLRCGQQQRAFWMFCSECKNSSKAGTNKKTCCAKKKQKSWENFSVIDYKQPSKPWTPLLRNKQTSNWGS